MIYLYNTDRVVEAIDFSGIVEELKSKDYSLPRFKIIYKQRVLQRMGKEHRLTKLFTSDESFVKMLEKSGDIKKVSRLFVYGTIKRGFRNHLILGECSKHKEGDARIRPYILYSNGVFPMAVKGNGSIKAEAYLVYDNVLDRVDLLENGLYSRELVYAKDGRNGFVYVWHNDIAGLERIKGGEWKAEEPLAQT